MKETTDNLMNKMLIATKATSPRNLSKYLEISPQAIYKAIKKDKIPRVWIHKIAEKTGYDVEWFFEASQPMIDNLKTTKKVSEKYRTDVYIPIVEARLSAGSGSFITDDTIENEIRFDSNFFLNKGNPQNMVIMRVMGDSMQPEIMDNDLVMIDQSKTVIQQNRIFAVSFEDCIYLKRIDLLPGKVILKSVNPAYSPIELDIQGDMESLFRVIGKVLWVGREYN